MNFEAQLLNKRILIVDDDVSLSKSIKEVFGEQALRILVMLTVLAKE